jgi:alkylation response protein AidB-like acyl-CoA dehydrogenase
VLRAPAQWHVTYGDVAAVYIVMAKALVDGEELPTLFLVDAERDGISVVDDPPFTSPPRDLSALFARPTGPLSFAGEHLGGEFAALMEGASAAAGAPAGALLGSPSGAKA